MTDTNNTPTTADNEPFDTNDAHQLLAKHRMIGVVWCIEDVKEVRPHLTDDQAWEVLQEVERKHNAELGISWMTLEIFADDMFPEPDDE
jgi:hypothetical protein